jgi:hypothetical protein
MSRSSDWVIELQMDKIDLSREEFIAKYGTQYAYIYDEQLGLIPEEPECLS